MISEFRNRITLTEFMLTTDGAGGIVKTPVNEYDVWAKIEETSGNRSLDNMQISYSNSYRVTIRAEQSRPVNENFEISYKGARLSIQSITRETEGRENFLIINAYSTNEHRLTPSPTF